VATRLYLAGTLAEGGAVELDAASAHRLRHVLRLDVGAAVAGFNARDGEFLCRVAGFGRDRATLAVEVRRRPPAAEPELWLVFAPIKRLRLDWLVEKATELGVSALVPVVTARTQPERLNRDRLAAHAVAAAEQCGRLSVPEVRSLARLDRVLADWAPARRLLWCDETGGGVALADVAAGIAPGAAAILVGPEGGFADAELDALAVLPFVTRVGLGPRVLRAETAAVAALAAFQAIAGDWRGPPQR
jgi:16S rRNA (uracil1498-N3)-methyltransferase